MSGFCCSGNDDIKEFEPMVCARDCILPVNGKDRPSSENWKGGGGDVGDGVDESIVVVGGKRRGAT